MPIFLGCISFCCIFIVTIIIFTELKTSNETSLKILLFITITLSGISLLGIIKYNIEPKNIVKTVDTYEIYWIENEPYINFKNNLTKLNGLLHKNIPSDTKNIMISYEELEMRPYGIFYPNRKDFKIKDYKFVPNNRFKLLPNNDLIELDSEINDTCVVEEKSKTV